MTGVQTCALPISTGTTITNQARIIFDLNASIDTPVWLNTLDVTKPRSQVLPLAVRQSSASFTVNWSGTDEGAGITGYTIFVAENGGLFTPWLVNTPFSTAVFTGQVERSYSFYSIARDGAGNEEDAPSVADTTTSVGSSEDLCPNDPEKTAPGACGCGVPDSEAGKTCTTDSPVSVAPGSRSVPMEHVVVNKTSNPGSKSAMAWTTTVVGQWTKGIRAVVLRAQPGCSGSVAQGPNPVRTEC